MKTYRQFIFQDYKFNSGTKTLDLHYSMDDMLHFRETYTFDFDFGTYNEQLLDRAIQSLFFMAGVSYYKTYIPLEIVVRRGDLDADSAAFFSKTYQRGLGEFWYVNQLDPNTPVQFPVTMTHELPHTLHSGKGALVGLGGGKDSLLTIETLRSATAVTTWTLGHKKQLEPLTERIGLPHLQINREWDRKLLEVNNEDALNGHVPISAIFACVGVVAAVLSGKQDIVVSNEQAANEPTLQYRGVDINHQYSKSQEFEIDFQNYLHRNYKDSIRYYSFLRPLSELYIAELFAGSVFSKYKDVFSSCNKAFVHTSERLTWCGKCPKCAFVFLILTPFIEQKELEALWSGKNLLLDPDLEATYEQLLGIAGDKPLECIGEIKESRMAMHMAFEKYPQLIGTYEFEVPPHYDFRQLMADEMPEDVKHIFRRLIV